MVLQDFLVIFEHLDRMPAQICEIRILLPQKVFYPLDPILDLPVIADDHALGTFLIMMYHSVHQHVKSCALSRGDWNHRDPAKHLRKSVKIDLHSTLFDDIHHIESQNDWFL